MAKRKQSAAGTAAENRTKKLKPVSKRKMQNEAKAKNGPGNGVTIERKNTSKPRSSPKPARASASRTTTTSTTSKYFTSPLKAQPKTSDDDDDEDDFDMVPTATTTVETESEEDDWEEVEELDGPLGPVGPSSELVLPSHPIEIEIETPDLVHKRQKREKRKAEWETYLRRVVNRFNKDVLIDTHKVHLMCLIANGMCRNRLCNEPDLLAITLSLLPVHFSNVTKERIDNLYLSGLLKWFVATFTLNPSLAYEEHPDPRGLLERRLASLSARDHREMTHLFLLVLRSLQLFCRLVLSLQPISFKPPPARGKGARSSSSAPGESNPPGQTAHKDGTTPSEPRGSRGTKRPAGGKAKGERGGKKAKRKNIKEEEDEEEVGGGGGRSVTTGGQKPKNAKRRSVASKVSYKEESESEGREGWLSEAAEEFQPSSAEEESEDSEGGAESQKGKKKGKGKTKAKTNLKGKKGKGKGKAKANYTNKSQRGKGKSKANTTTTPQSKSGGYGKVTNKQEDDKWEEGEDNKRGGGGGGGRVMINKGFTRKSGGLRIRGPGADEWLEVFVPKTSSWVCVDVQQGVARPHLCPQNATAPVTYVVSVDGHGHLKDLGRKYDPTWMTSSKKRRVEEDWWEDTLRPFLGPELERDRQEDKELNAKMIDKPLPTSIAEYKNHPLYCLKRHMLKYEALYPTTAAVLGYCRGEPVYSRYCVHTMHSKDTWLKEARTVRLGELPYKMVKGFSNKSRKARIVSEQREEKDLPLFGEWQTEEYMPPIAVNGKVPRNDYGNVYLFKPCMLPVGCVHLRLPSLHRVAKKLDMDAAPAITGFDFHGGFSHAVTDGYVVCEEHEEVLRAAWLEDQQIQKQKEEEKREKRVVSNWTLLVKGLLIRERLQRRYGMKKNQGPGGAGTSSQTHTPAGDKADGLLSDDEEEEEVEGGGPAITTAAETLAMSWPQNRQEEEDMNANVPTKKTSKREKKGQQKHLFPFEKV